MWCFNYSTSYLIIMTCHAFHEKVILECDSSPQMESRSTPIKDLTGTCKCICNVAQKVSIHSSGVVSCSSNQV